MRLYVTEGIGKQSGDLHLIGEADWLLPRTGRAQVRGGGINHTGLEMAGRDKKRACWERGARDTTNNKHRNNNYCAFLNNHSWSNFTQTQTSWSDEPAVIDLMIAVCTWWRGSTSNDECSGVSRSATCDPIPVGLFKTYLRLVGGERNAWIPALEEVSSGRSQLIQLPADIPLQQTAFFQLSSTLFFSPASRRSECRRGAIPSWQSHPVWRHCMSHCLKTWSLRQNLRSTDGDKFVSLTCFLTKTQTNF